MSENDFRPIMKLTEYILRRNERSSTWAFVHSWIPAKTSRYSWWRVLLVTVALSGFSTGLLWCLLELLIRTGAGEMDARFLERQRAWMVEATAEWTALIGLCWSIVSRLCWNQRANRLAASPGSPELNQEWPRRGFFTGTLTSWGYFWIVAVATPTLLFYSIENARGAWAWNRMQARLKAQGVCYDLDCLIPPPARDEENFFATPFWSNFEYKTVPEMNGRGSRLIWAVTNWSGKQMHLPPVKTRPPLAQQRQFEDTDGRIPLADWAEAFRESATHAATNAHDISYRPYPIAPGPGQPAEDVLLALSLYDGYLAEFAAAAYRPRNRYPAHYGELFSTVLPYLNQIKLGAQICQLRAVANLAQGNSVAAATNTLLGFRLAESLQEEVFLISHMVRFASDAINLHTLWEGTLGHHWTDAQLVAFQKILSQREYTHGMIQSVGAERIVGCAELDRAIDDRWNQLQLFDSLSDARSEESSGDADGLHSAIPYLMPTGWLRYNQIRLMEGYQRLLDVARMKLAPDRSREAMKTAEESEKSFDQLLIDNYGGGPKSSVAGRLLPALGKAFDKANRAQSLARMGVIACALERYHFAQNRYPQRLDELVPTYLAAVPTDWMGGGAFHYRPTDDGWFQLWSVGPNGIDDGGILRKIEPNGKIQSDELDWPWPSPAKSRQPRVF
jgi:hypothetical protein